MLIVISANFAVQFSSIEVIFTLDSKSDKKY